MAGNPKAAVVVKTKRAPQSAKPKRTASERNGKLLTDEEVADVLACTARRVRKLFYAGDLAGVYVGGLLRFEITAVDEYIERNRVHTPRDFRLASQAVRRMRKS